MTKEKFLSLLTKLKVERRPNLRYVHFSDRIVILLFLGNRFNRRIHRANKHIVDFDARFQEWWKRYNGWLAQWYQDNRAEDSIECDEEMMAYYRSVGDTEIEAEGKI